MSILFVKIIVAKVHTVTRIPLMEKSLLDRTLDLLRKDKRNLSQLATESGLGYFWLRRVKNGSIANPGIRQIEKLHATLTK